jgi:hypothetical protein
MGLLVFNSLLYQPFYLTGSPTKYDIYSNVVHILDSYILHCPYVYDYPTPIMFLWFIVIPCQTDF